MYEDSVCPGAADVPACSKCVGPRLLPNVSHVSEGVSSNCYRILSLFEEKNVSAIEVNVWSDVSK